MLILYKSHATSNSFFAPQFWVWGAKKKPKSQLQTAMKNELALWKRGLSLWACSNNSECYQLIPRWLVSPWPMAEFAQICPILLSWSLLRLTPGFAPQTPSQQQTRCFWLVLVQKQNGALWVHYSQALNQVAKAGMKDFLLLQSHNSFWAWCMKQKGEHSPSQKSSLRF